MDDPVDGIGRVHVLGRRGARRLAVDGAIAVLFAIGALIVSFNIEHEPDGRWDGLGVVLVLVVAGGLVLRTTAPLAALATIVGALVVYTVRDYPGSPIYLAALVPLYTLASTRGWRRTLVPAAITIGGLLAVGLTASDPAANLGYHIAFAGWSAAVVFLGEATRNRRAYLAGLEQRARDLEETREEEARRLVAEERLRIARDLHDVIAHGIATIHLQSGVAAHVLDRHPEQAGPALQAIKATSKEVLDELRATLDVLRAADDATPLAPTPGLDRLDDLVDATRRAGLPVELRRSGDGPARLPAAVDTAAFRIVQESLTNVMRHAGRARAAVHVARTGDEVEIEVTDDGAGLARPPASPGHGIAGMRERAETLGGRLVAGPRPGGGFRVHARLPVVRSGG